MSKNYDVQLILLIKFIRFVNKRVFIYLQAATSQTEIYFCIYINIYMKVFSLCLHLSPHHHQALIRIVKGVVFAYLRKRTQPTKRIHLSA